MPQSRTADRLPFWGGLGLCVLVCAAHLVDLALYIDADSGFAARGSALVRCAVLAVAAALLWWLGRSAAADFARPAGTVRTLSAVMRLTGSALVVLVAVRLGTVWQMITDLLQYSAGGMDFWQVYALLTLPGMPGLLITCLLALLAALWLLRVGPRALLHTVPPAHAGAGVLLLAWPFWMALQRFLIAPAAVERLPDTLRVLSAAALLLFAAALLRAVYVPAVPNGPGLYRAGMLCFLCSTCLELPQTLFELMHGAGNTAAVLTALAIGLLGLCGLVTAWLTCGPPEKTAAPDPKTDTGGRVRYRSRDQAASYSQGPAQNGPKI